METLVAIPQHKIQSYRRKGSKIRHDQFGSVPLRDFRGINCRSFVAAPSGGGEASKKGKRSSPVPITRKPSVTRNDIGELSNSELWAGPAYSISPPPSSLPIPKFSLRQRRSVSLDPPAAPHSPVTGIHSVAKSAPASPTERSSGCVGFFISNSYATEVLRRILNLDGYAIDSGGGVGGVGVGGGGGGNLLIGGRLVLDR